MHPNSPTARRFPLIARFRPACLPLPKRVHHLVELAGTAARKADQGLASAVYNQSALLASDLGLPALARELCHRHATAYLQAAPLPAMSAIRGLEPVVNLARLRIRADQADHGRQHLLDLYEAIASGTAARFDDIAIPAHLTATSQDRGEVRAWLWRVLLADGTRTLTSLGRWQEALAHVEKHHGVGNRMLDGRQVTVLAALTSGDTRLATELLTHTTPGDPWEQAVTACLTALSQRANGQPLGLQLTELVGTHLGRKPEPGMTVFDIRLGLTILDVASTAEHALARRIVDDLHRRTAEANDGYAARENLAHPLFNALATERQTQDCHNLVVTCALGNGTMPATLEAQLLTALHTSDRVIRDSL